MLCFLFLWFLKFIIFSLIVRRNHDLGHTGFDVFVVICSFGQFFLCAISSFCNRNVGANQYGIDLREGGRFLDDFLNRKYDQSDFDSKIN